MNDLILSHGFGFYSYHLKSVDLSLILDLEFSVLEVETINYIIYIYK